MLSLWYENKYIRNDMSRDLDGHGGPLWYRYIDVIWASWCLKSAATLLFFRLMVHIYNKEQLKSPHPIGWIHLTKDKKIQWRHNGRDSVSNHQLHDCLLNRLFRRRSKKASKLPVTGLCGDRWIPRTNGQLHRKYFNLTTSSWSATRLYVHPPVKRILETPTRFTHSNGSPALDQSTYYLFVYELLVPDCNFLSRPLSHYLHISWQTYSAILNWLKVGVAGSSGLASTKL